MKKRIIYALALILTILMCASCTSLESTAKEREIVLTIGGFDVPYELFRYALLNTKDDVDGRDDSFWDGNADRDELVAKIFADAIEALKTRYAILSLAKDYGISMDDKLIQDKITNDVGITKNNYEKDADYIAALKAEHMNHSVYSFLVGVEHVNEELYYAMVNKGDITNDTDEIKNIVESDEFICVKHILIKFDSDGDGKEDGNRADKLARLEAIREEALNGADFDTLVDKHGQDMNMLGNHDGYYMTRGSDYLEFENAAFDLEIGEISEVIETPIGYTVILRCEKDADYIEDNIDDLSYYYASCRFALALEARMAELDVTTTDAYNGIDIFNMK